MSSTNRGRARVSYDDYPTPAWCVRRLVEAVDLPDGRWVEPCAGHGSIISAIDRRVDWTAVEIRPECREPLELLASQAYIRDFRNASLGTDYDVCITNPPYNLAMEAVLWGTRAARITVMLLRLNFLGSAKRSDFMAHVAPDVYVLPNRPSFTGKGTDSIEYAWFVWRRATLLRRCGKIQVLAATPRSERM